jgi:outer membrane lipoprotein SlyB
MWAMGEDAIAGVEVAARELAVRGDIPRQGRTLFIGRDAVGERPVALSPEAAKLHMVVAGASGSGKTTMLAAAALADIEHGFAGAVIDPKADLVETILSHIKPEHAKRIVVLDAGDDSRPVPGLDVLGGGDPDLRTDVLVGALKSIFPDWGIRSETYGRLAIRTLSEVPGATLADMGRLFGEEPYRRTAIASLRDPFLISSWQNYHGLTPAAQAEVVQAPMARVMALLSRPRVRAVLASPDPKLDLRRLLAERKWLLVSLAPGVLGEAAAALIGAAVMYAIWSAIEARVALPPDRRHPIYLYVDELATVTNGLPFGFELLAERARGLGAGLTVALQTLGRIPEPTRSALLGNAATFVTFRAAAEEAPRLARQVPPLTEADLVGLQAFRVAARIGTGTGSAVAVVTGRTEPLPPETGRAKAIRDRSALAYGASRQPHDDDIRRAQEPPSQGEDDDESGSLGRTRRAL